MRFSSSIAVAAIIACLGITAVVASSPDDDRGSEREGGPRGFGGPDGPRMPPIPILEALDINRDGVLDADEIDKAPASLKSLDRNEDGKLTFNEMMPNFRDRRPGGPPGSGRPEMRGDRPRSEGGPGGPDRRGPAEDRNARGGSPEEVLRRVLSLDKDGDGKLSGEELPERMKTMMLRADSDGDGSLSKEEIKRMVEMRGQGGGPRGDRRAPGQDAEGGQRPRRPPAEE